MNQDQETIRQAMSILGKRTSPKKAEAARINGMKGGRPKKKPAVSISNATRQEIVSETGNKVTDFS